MQVEKFDVNGIKIPHYPVSGFEWQGTPTIEGMHPFGTVHLDTGDRNNFWAYVRKNHQWYRFPLQRLIQPYEGYHSLKSYVQEWVDSNFNFVTLDTIIQVLGGEEYMIGEYILPLPITNEYVENWMDSDEYVEMFLNNLNSGIGYPLDYFRQLAEKAIEIEPDLRIEYNVDTNDTMTLNQKGEIGQGDVKGFFKWWSNEYFDYSLYEFVRDECMGMFYDYLAEWAIEAGHEDSVRDYIREHYMDSNYPMWDTLFEWKHGSGEYANDDAQASGFGVVEGFGDFNNMLFVAGAGYDFYESHWIPLFKRQCPAKAKEIMYLTGEIGD